MSGPPQFAKWRNFLAQEGHNIQSFKKLSESQRYALRTKYHGGPPPKKTSTKKVYRRSPVIRSAKAKQLFLNSGGSRHAMLLDIKQRNKSIHHLGTKQSGLYKHPNGPRNHDIVGIDDGSKAAIEMWKKHFKRTPGAHRPITKARHDALAKGRAVRKANIAAKKKRTVAKGPTRVSGSKVKPVRYTVRSSVATTKKNKKGQSVLTDAEKKRRYALRTGKKQSDLTVVKGVVRVKKSAGGRGTRATKN